MHSASRLAVLALTFIGLEALTPDEIAQFRTKGTLETNTGIAGWVAVEDTGRQLYVTSNGIPDHRTGPFPGPGNPNAIQVSTTAQAHTPAPATLTLSRSACINNPSRRATATFSSSSPFMEQSFRLKVRKTPVYATTPGCLPMGPVALAINGVPMYNPQSAECEDAVINERFDSCHGHPDMPGRYHYHQNPICAYVQVDGKASPLVGVAADGFPIYGPVDETGRTLTSADLDECHGREVNGQYQYHITTDYPYILSCFRGRVLPDAGVGRRCVCPVKSARSQQSLLDVLRDIAKQGKQTTA
ncbi:Hypp3975 [Branchiostoma lanceolatum]|uniref:Hypp3975 protein n=1 Tax=Branchiostoma lanceolatum TaxID=7740 RepID=A0A8K0A3U2_BRALA|nr:Hypp3975 [Branchiostoma lanceolatum]